MEYYDNDFERLLEEIIEEATGTKELMNSSFSLHVLPLSLSDSDLRREI